MQLKKFQSKYNRPGDLSKFKNYSQRLVDYYNNLIVDNHNREANFIVLKKTKSRWLLLPFTVGLLLLVLVLQSLSYAGNAVSARHEILGAATSAYADLNSAQSNLKNQNFGDAQQMFNNALTSLDDAQSKLNAFRALQLVAPQARSANHVLTGASFLAAAGTELTSALAVFNNLKISANGIENANFTQILTENKNKLDTALNQLQRARVEFTSVSDLPSNYEQTLNSAKSQIDLLTGLLQSLVKLEDIYLGMFGNGPKVYLLIFQNYDEVRATGGFIGTYGVLKVSNGKIADLKIDSIYDIDGHIYDQVAAPGPMQPAIPKWGMRDANWFVDFPTSARKLLQFFESGSQTADGVIAVTPNMFEELLKLTGSINLPKYNVVLTPDNFQKTVQFKTSIDYDKKLNQPKKFLADFAPLLLDRMSKLSPEQMLQLLQIFQNNLNQKQILLFSKDTALQQKIEDARMAGNILDSDQDYLNIVNTNLGGTKTDLEIKQSVTLASKILSDGSIINTLIIQRQNQAREFNRNYMRVLVPLGSTLLSSNGFDQGQFLPSTAENLTQDSDLKVWDTGVIFSDDTFVRTEAKKTEFAGWQVLQPEETKAITLKYMIPYKAQVSLLNSKSAYGLLLQKQTGTREYEFQAQIDTGNFKPYWLSADAVSESGRVKFNYNTKSDQYWAILLSR